MARKVFIYLLGVLLGIFILQLIPRKEPREPHPWHEQTAPLGSYPREVEDDLSRIVVLKAQPRWVVSLAPSITETLFAMDMGDHISAVTRWDTYPEQALRLRDSGFSIGDIDAPDIERMHTLPMDVVLGSKLTPQHIYEKITSVKGVPALAVDATTLDDFLDGVLPLLSEVLGVPGKGLKLKLELLDRRKAVADRLAEFRQLPPKRVVLLLGIEDTLQPGWSPGRGTWLGSLIEEAHGDNLAADLGTEWGTFPLESLLAADPDVILIKDAEGAAASAALHERVKKLKIHPLWQHLKAVQTDQVFLLPSGPLSIPGPRMIDALEAIAEAVWGLNDHAGAGASLPPSETDN